MPITSVKIHPAIGIARLGNSPDEFFIGPEQRWDVPDPPGGFKDGQCRIKRQAARFRVFAYHDDGTVEELTADSAEISWTVHLVNKKAVLRNGGAPAAQMTIDPGARTLDGPDQRQLFDDGKITFPGTSAVTVPLGEARTDDAGRLLVLGGFGTSATPTGAPIVHFADNAGWYDDAADGPVSAHVKLGDGTELDAEGAWVIVGPPKFAPQIESPITLYDAVFQMAVSQGWAAVPNPPSYTDDIFPILESARTIRWVYQIFSAHTWADPVYDPGDRLAIFNRLRNPGGGGSNMPLLQAATLTSAQYAAMEAWRDDNFTRDWAGLPAPEPLTPEGLDRTALTNCVGAAFFPGIEAGGISTQPIITPGNHVGPADWIRLDHGAVAAGDMTQRMAVPWQADFKACGSQWWPVPRPNQVIPQGTSAYEAWDRDVNSSLEMVHEWHTLGFVVRQGSEYVEVDRCDSTFITLLTPSLVFQDVPQGPMGMSRKVALPIVFEVRSPGAAVTLQIQSGPVAPRIVPLATADTVGPTAGASIATARLWLTYQTGPSGETLTDSVTVVEPVSGQTWTIAISANTVDRKVAAAALVLDRSGSMTEDRGDGQSKHQSLKEAASIFVDVMLEGDGVGLVRYDHDAQPVMPITALGPAGDPFGNRQTTKDLINGPDFTPAGATSIGDGIFEGRQLLSAATGYDVESLVVLTDGVENTPRWIADVAADIDERTYSVGLGTPQNTSAAALQTISGNNGGYLLVTGPIVGDNRFILQKYFLQILAGISNAEVVLDPDGVLVRGIEHRIPFQLTEADAGVDVILLSRTPQAVDFRLQTPNGFILHPWRALSEASMRWTMADGVAYYRLVLPAELFTARYDQAGTWHALLRIGRPQVEKPREPDRLDIPQPRVPPRPALDVGPRREPPTPLAAAIAAPASRAVPYSLIVHTYSDVSLRATLVQSGYEPGATATIEATLAHAGVPARPGATAWVEITRPDGTGSQLALAEQEPGRFAGAFTTSASGTYRCRVRATGRTTGGYPFHREQTITAVVWRGGDRDADPDRPRGGEATEKLCRLLKCVLGKGGVLTPELERRLREAGVDIPRLRRCLAAACRPTRGGAGVEEAELARLASQLLGEDDG